MNYIIVAGVPQALAEDFSALRKKRFEEIGWNVIWSSVNDVGENAYTGDFARKLHGKFLEVLEAQLPKRVVTNGERFSARAVLVYVNYEKAKSGINNLLDEFFPSVLPAAISPLDATLWQAKPKQNRAHAAKQLVEKILSVLRSVERALPGIEKQVVSRINKSCLLLPSVHFKSDELVPFLKKLCTEIVEQKMGVEQIHKKIQKFEEEKLNHIRRNKIRSFVDDRHLQFHSPGSALHAHVRIDDLKVHLPKCSTAAWFRLGAAFEPRFHYDCEPSKGSLVHSWDGCHFQKFDLPSGRDHVNIAPNDGVR